MTYEPFVGFGTRKGIVFELDQYGLPAAPDVNPYTGLEIYGVRNFEMTYPEPRRVPHFNGDRVGLVQQFPSLEAAAGTIVVDGNDLNLTSILASVEKFTVSGIEMMPFLTDKQGEEPNVGLLIYQAAKKTTGVLGWHVQFIASTTMVPRPGPYGDNNYETRYALAPNAVNHFLWGPELTDEAHGAIESGVIDGFALYKPRITSWNADGIEDTFLFDTTQKPTDATYIVVQSVAGVVSILTSGIVKTVDSVAFAYPPDENVTVHALHMIL